MTLLGEVHLPAHFSIPLLLLAAGGIAWYWLRLGRPGVPSSRRRIRRFSIVLMLIGLPVLGKALSFVDPALQHQHRDYIVTWTVVLLFVLGVVITAGIDVVNNLRLHHAQQTAEMHEAAVRLREAIAQRGARLHEPSARAEGTQRSRGRGDAASARASTSNGESAK